MNNRPFCNHNLFALWWAKDGLRGLGNNDLISRPIAGVRCGVEFFVSKFKKERRKI